MKHVLKHEGVTFCDDITLEHPYFDVGFSDGEIKILKQLHYELDHEDCKCVFVTNASGDKIKVESCDFHK